MRPWEGIPAPGPEPERPGEEPLRGLGREWFAWRERTDKHREWERADNRYRLARLVGQLDEVMRTQREISCCVDLRDELLLRLGCAELERIRDGR